MKHKYEAGQIVKIYQNPSCVSGGVGKILERDVDDLSYLVGEDFEKAIWIKEEDLEVLSFEKVQEQAVEGFEYLMGAFSLGLLVGWYFL